MLFNINLPKYNFNIFVLKTVINVLEIKIFVYNVIINFNQLIIPAKLYAIQDYLQSKINVLLVIKIVANANIIKISA